MPMGTMYLYVTMIKVLVATIKQNRASNTVSECISDVTYLMEIGYTYTISHLVELLFMFTAMPIL